MNMCVWFAFLHLRKVDSVSFQTEKTSHLIVEAMRENVVNENVVNDSE